MLRGNRATFVRRRARRRADASASRALAATSPTREATDNVLGYLWAKEAYGAMLFATAVSDLPIADALASRATARCLLALAREVLAEAPVAAASRSTASTRPTWRARSSGWSTFNRRSAKTHSGIYRDLAVRHRPTEASRCWTASAGRWSRRDRAS